MAIDVAQLSVQVDTTDLQDGTAALNKFAATGETTEKRVNRSAASIERGFRKVGGSQNVVAGGSRNLALQLSQVAQQGAVTGNYLQALAIQLPDMAIGFGTIGIAAGVAAGALLPLIANVIDLGDKTADFEDAFESVADIANGLQENLDVLGMSVAELTRLYGEAALSVRRFAMAQAEIAAAQAGRRLSDQVDAMQSLLSAYEEGYWNVTDYDNAVRELVGTLDVTRYQARQVAAALAEMGDGATLDDQVAAMETLIALADDMGFELSQLPPEIQDAISEMITYTREVSAAEEAAHQVAAAVANITANTTGAANEASRLASNLAAAAALERATGGGPDQARRDVMSGDAQRQFFEEQTLPAQLKAYNDSLRAASKGGGGRKSSGGGGGGVDPLLAEAERLFKDTRTAAEEYAAELERVNMLHDKGYITADTYTRAIDMIDEKYQEAIGAGKEFEELQTMLKDAVLDFAENGVDSLDDLAAAIRRAALEALLFGQGPLGGILGGAGGKGLLGGLLSFDGGGFTGRGARSGGLDGKGGFLAMLHPNETVSDHTKGQGGSGVHVTVSMDNNGNMQAYVDRVASNKTAAGLKQYDRAVAPRTISRQRRDPRRIG